MNAQVADEKKRIICAVNPFDEALPLHMGS